MFSYIRLRKMVGNDNLRYWRTADGQEIDFIAIHDDRSGDAIEVKFDETNFSPSKYRKFRSHYPEYDLHLRAFRASTNLNSLMAL